MKKHTLTAEERTVTGRKAKHLRKRGMIPATVYGKNVDSESISVKLDDFSKLYAETGETGLIEMTVGKSIKPVLIHNVQTDPVTREILHIEFHQVDLKQKVHAEVPLVIEGTAPAAEQKLGLLIQVLNAIDVEALPTDLPERITVNVSKLANVGDELRVSDLSIPQGVSVSTDAALTVARISPLPQEEVVEAPVPAEGAEVPVPAEGETPSETPAPENAEEE